MGFAWSAARLTIGYQSIENAIFDGAAFVNNAAIYGTQIFALLVNRVSVEEIIVAAFQIYVAGVAA